jgi:hypothetical protein
MVVVEDESSPPLQERRMRFKNSNNIFMDNFIHEAFRLIIGTT